MSIKQESNAKFRDKVFGSFLWQAIGSVAQSLIKLVTLAVLARLLTATAFGLVASVTFIVGFARTFAISGIHQNLVRLEKLEPADIQVSFTLSLLQSSGLLLVTVLIAPFYATYMQEPALTSLIQVASLLYLFSGLGIVAQALLERDLHFKTIARIRIISFTVGYATVGIGLAWAGAGAWSLIAAILAEAGMATFLFLIKKPHTKRLSLQRDVLVKTVNYGFGMMLGGIANYLARQGDYFVIGRQLGTDLLGYYSRAYSLMAQPALLFSQVGGKVAFSAGSRLQENPEAMRTAYLRGYTVLALIALPSSFGIFILGEEIVAILLGSQWDLVVVPLQILALGTYLRVGYKLSGILTNVDGAVYQYATVQLVYAILVLSGGFYGSRWGINGVAIAVLGALIVQFLLLTAVGLRVTGIRWGQLLKAHVPGIQLALIVGLIGGAAAVGTRSLLLPAVVIVGATLLAVALVVLIFMRLSPERLLGVDGLWWLNAFLQRTPVAVQPFLSSLLNIPILEQSDS